MTTGNYGGIDLWLETTAGALAFKTAPVSGAVCVAELGVEPKRSRQAAWTAQFGSIACQRP